MSCSDKVLKWVHLGIQGAYLRGKICIETIVVEVPLVNAHNQKVLERGLRDRYEPAQYPEIIAIEKCSEESAKQADKSTVWSKLDGDQSW